MSKYKTNSSHQSNALIHYQVFEACFMMYRYDAVNTSQPQSLQLFKLLYIMYRLTQHGCGTKYH